MLPTIAGFRIMEAPTAAWLVSLLLLANLAVLALRGQFCCAQSFLKKHGLSVWDPCVRRPILTDDGDE